MWMITDLSRSKDNGYRRKIDKKLMEIPEKAGLKKIHSMLGKIL